MTTIRTAVFIFLLTIPATGQLPVERHVRGQTITSDSLPRATITFDRAFRYAGGQRFILYGVAEAEQHFFVDAGANHYVRRFYWVQFERYLPGNNEHYRYVPTHVNQIGGLYFINDTRIYTDYNALQPSPDSDSAKARALLSSKGFRLPRTAIRARLIHLPDPDNRSELMIIYMEALPASGLPPDAKNELAADDRFPGLAAFVTGNARRGLKISGLMR
jgi:hypothetical protein